MNIAHYFLHIILTQGSPTEPFSTPTDLSIRGFTQGTSPCASDSCFLADRKRITLVTTQSHRTSQNQQPDIHHRNRSLSSVIRRHFFSYKHQKELFVSSILFLICSAIIRPVSDPAQTTHRPTFDRGPTRAPSVWFRCRERKAFFPEKDYLLSLNHDTSQDSQLSEGD